ncbi:hypothetical protein C8J57DRAFT_1257360 [Mycena rebaudengoi]|nr:hypothetical protein C8J57DRAFT_1257360 [Mycena rebaudengoi]
MSDFTRAMKAVGSPVTPDEVAVPEFIRVTEIRFQYQIGTVHSALTLRRRVVHSEARPTAIIARVRPDYKSPLFERCYQYTNSEGQLQWRAPTLQQPNNLQGLIKSKKIAIGTGLSYPSVQVAKTIAVTGADWCWILYSISSHGAPKIHHKTTPADPGQLCRSSTRRHELSTRPAPQLNGVR